MPALYNKFSLKSWQEELLDWVSACQSAYHIDSTPGHRFGGLGSNLEENRQGVVDYVTELLSQEPSKHFQSRVRGWVLQCFGRKIADDKLERGDRLLEEVLELLQSGNYPKERIAMLADYTYGRPVGEPAQELGGVMVTLAAYSAAHDLQMHTAGWAELSRVWGMMDKIRAKQAAKPKDSPLPVAQTERKVRGWAVVANDGTTTRTYHKLISFFGAVMEQPAPDAEVLYKFDREWPGLAPHHIVTLYE